MIAVLVVLIVILVIKLLSGKRRNETNEVGPTNIHSKDYRRNIYDNTSSQHRDNIRHLYERLDALDSILRRNNDSLNAQAAHIAHEVLEKAKSAEQEIENHWERNKQKADFYFYIGLHYTSFTLADRLTEELVALRSFLEMLTKLIDSTQRQIDILKARIEQSDNRNDIGSIKYEHRELCKKCDSLRKIREVCKNQRNSVKRCRDAQNTITAKRRDYIGTHFGAKGRQWRAKIMARHKRFT